MIKRKLDKPAGKSKKATPSKEQKPKVNAEAKKSVKKTPAKASKPTKVEKSKPVAASKKVTDSDKIKSSSKVVKDKSIPQPKAKSKTEPVSKKASNGGKDLKKQTKPVPEKKTTSKKEIKTTDITLEILDLSVTTKIHGDSVEKIWRPKQFATADVKREFGFPNYTPELPGNYGETQLVLMPKDPEYMFCYWEITPQDLALKEKEKLPTNNYRETLKINWDSDSLFDPNFTFIPVFFWARKWYFGVPQIGHQYQVDLGWLSDSGHFISIIKSNYSDLPESWNATQERLINDSSEVLSFTSSKTIMQGSSGQIVVNDSRQYQPDWNLNSESMSSSNLSAKQSQGSKVQTNLASSPKKKSQEKFEVSGKVYPDTHVSIGGIAAKVNKDGNFKIDITSSSDVLTVNLKGKNGSTRPFTYNIKEMILS